MAIFNSYVSLPEGRPFWMNKGSVCSHSPTGCWIAALISDWKRWDGQGLHKDGAQTIQSVRGHAHHLLQHFQALGRIDAVELLQVQDQTIAQPRILLFHALLGLREACGAFRRVGGRWFCFRYQGRLQILRECVKECSMRLVGGFLKMGVPPQSSISRWDFPL